MKLNEQVKLYRKQAKMTQQALADAMGVSRVAVIKWENGTNKPSTGKLSELATALNITMPVLLGESSSLPKDAIPIKGFASLPVLGNVQAGTFIMVDDNQTPVPDLLHISVPLVEGFDADKHYLLKVIGDSMNKRIPDGYYAICVEINGQAPKIGDIVVVERLKDGGQLVETTIKRLSEINGRRALVPESYDPKFTTIYPDKEINGTEIRVVAVVVNAIAGGF